MLLSHILVVYKRCQFLESVEFFKFWLFFKLWIFLESIVFLKFFKLSILLESIVFLEFFKLSTFLEYIVFLKFFKLWLLDTIVIFFLVFGLLALNLVETVCWQLLHSLWSKRRRISLQCKRKEGVPQEKLGFFFFFSHPDFDFVLRKRKGSQRRLNDPAAKGGIGEG